MLAISHSEPDSRKEAEETLKQSRYWLHVSKKKKVLKFLKMKNGGLFGSVFCLSYAWQRRKWKGKKIAAENKERKLSLKTDWKYNFSPAWFSKEKGKERKIPKKLQPTVFLPKLARKSIENRFTEALHFLKNKTYQIKI